MRILKQYERGVQFRLGRVEDGARGPGVIFIIPLVDRETASPVVPNGEVVRP